jgi:predicted nucleotidyltransferase
MAIGFKQYLINEVSPNAVDIKTRYHDELNPDIWTKDDELDKPVRKALLKIAKEFVEFLAAPEMDIKDIILTGSLANYNYTPQSDIDLHIVANATSKLGKPCKFDLAEFFSAKKTLWNEQHDITIYGYPVELYVQLADENLVATGIYSVQDDKWITKPKVDKDAASIDKYAVKLKAAEMMSLIDKIIDNKVDSKTSVQKLTDRIWNMRKAGLSSTGEFSVENITFKTLRNNGYIKKLIDYRRSISDDDLSLD